MAENNTKSLPTWAVILMTLGGGSIGAGTVQVALTANQDAEVVTEIELKQAINGAIYSDALTHKIDKEVNDHPTVTQVTRDIKDLKKDSIQAEEDRRAIQTNIETLLRKERLEDEIVKPRRIPESELNRRVED